MKKRAKNYISKEMAMIAALNNAHYLLSQNIETMLYWSPENNCYNIVVDYETKFPKEIMKNVECTGYIDYRDIEPVKNRISFRYQY